MDGAATGAGSAAARSGLGGRRSNGLLLPAGSEPIEVGAGRTDTASSHREGYKNGERDTVKLQDPTDGL